MNDLVEQSGREVATQQEGGLSDSVARLSLLRHVLTDPNARPDAAREMAELMFKLEDRDREARFIAAKVAAIAAMPRMIKDGKADKSHYAKWETMQPIITPILSSHGLALNFEIGDENGKIAITPILSGHGWTERGGKMVLPSDVSGSKNPVQAVASSASYGKRHTAMAMLNIVTGGIIEDDDGNAAGGTALDAYSQLDKEWRNLVDKGRSIAGEGIAAYEQWYGGLATKEKGFLNFNQAWPSPMTWHAQNKDLAAKIG